MKCLELFAGSRSFGKVAELRDHKVFSMDIEDLSDMDLVIDILEWEPTHLDFIPDVIWASPPCNGFSVASMTRHWHKNRFRHVPVTDRSRLGIRIVRKTLRIIKYFTKQNPDLIFHIENPRALLRKMPFMSHLPRRTVTYCQYGDTVQKPTDIWSNNIYWDPRPACEPGSPCHQASPRSSYMITDRQSGTLAKKNARERAVIPAELMEEIIISDEQFYGQIPLKI